MFKVSNWFRAKLAVLSGRSRRATIIEDAQSGDLAALSDIHRAGFAAGWSDGDLDKMLANRHYTCLVARKQGAGNEPPLGFVLIRSVLDEAEVITIAVRPDWRQHGIARTLMEDTIRRLQHDRVKLLFLEVEAGNEAANKLYSRLGFEHVHDRKNYYPASANNSGKATDALVMKRNLG